MRFKEQIKNAVLEYLSPEAYKDRLNRSADMVTRDQANRTGSTPIKGSIQAGKQIDDLADTRSDRVAKVKRGRRGGGNSKLQRKGFDDKRAVGPNKSRPDTLKLGKTLDIEEQIKNAVLRYLDETFAGDRSRATVAANAGIKRHGSNFDPTAPEGAGGQATQQRLQKHADKRGGSGSVVGVGHRAGAQSRVQKTIRTNAARAQVTPSRPQPPRATPSQR